MNVLLAVLLAFISGGLSSAWVLALVSMSRNQQGGEK